MLFAPLRAIADLSFYRGAPKRSNAWIFGYLAYLALLFAVAGTVAVHRKVVPAVEATIDWAARSLPRLTFQDGRMTSDPPGPLRLEPPPLRGAAFLIDTSRTDAVTAGELEKAKAAGFLTQNALYLRAQEGSVERQDLSVLRTKEAVVVDGAFLRAAGETLVQVLYPAAFFLLGSLFLLRKLLAALAFSLAAMPLNAGLEAGLQYAELWRLAVVAQAPAAALEVAQLFLPKAVPFFGALTLTVVSVYLWQGVVQNRRAPQGAAPLD